MATSTSNSNSNTHSDTIDLTQTQTIVDVNMTNVTKLDGTNYLMWHRQVHALLKGYDLTGYLDGSLVAPPATTTVAGVVSANPTFKIWTRQDQLIYSALIGATAVSVQPLLSKANTSAEIWTTLQSIYATRSRAHIQQVRQQIKQWTKGTKNINEYFQGLTTRFDQLAHLGKPMEHEDQVERILEGLPDDYKRVIEQLESRDRTPPLTEVLEKLLNHEIKLKATIAATPSVPLTANAATVRGRNNYHGRGHYKQNTRPQQTWQQQQQFSPRQDGSTPRGYQGRCQICGVHGHSARTCSQFQMSPGQFNYSPRPANSTPWQPRANMVTATPTNANWFLDSGATHHLTSDLNNLSLHQVYNGGEDVTIADGSGEGSQNGGPITPREN